MHETAITMRQQVLGILHPLCTCAFERPSVTVLALVDGRRTTVVVSAPEGSADGLPRGTSASFTFSQLQVETLAGMGIPASDLATGAFREILEQLAGSAVDKTTFMASVHRRLQAAMTVGTLGGGWG